MSCCALLLQTVYERLGHAEVVRLNLSEETEASRKEFKTFADSYFKQFVKTPFGMSRSVSSGGGSGRV